VVDVAHENHFYNDEEANYEIDTESKLAVIESECAPIISKIISDESIKDVNDFEKGLLSLFTTIQMSRTNNVREFLAVFNKEIAGWARESGIDPNKDIENFQEQTEDEIKKSSIDILRTIPGDLAKELNEKELALIKSPKGENFYISDHPVVMHNYYPRPGRGNLGIGLRGIEIHFPITPRLCLIFLCNKVVSEIRHKIKDQSMRMLFGKEFPVDMTEIQQFLNDTNNKNTRLLKPENVEFHNSLQVSQSSRFLYSKNNDFELAKDILKSEL